MKKILAITLATCMVTALVGCGEETAKTGTFQAEYEMIGTTSSGAPKNDTFIFEGETDENGGITSLHFDIIRNKGTESEYSKKGIMNYMMNVSDAEVVKVDDGFELVSFTSYGYDTEYADGASAQYMVKGTIENLTTESVFSDVTFVNIATGGTDEVELEKAIVAYNDLASEAGIELTKDTLVVDLIASHGAYADGEILETSNRVSFAGYAGGRSYGEQIDAIAEHIVENNMTLEEVYEMFKTENQSSQPIEERDTVSGATITFVGDFQRMVYVAMYGELFEGVISTTDNEDGTKTYEVVTQGYAGEIETNITLNTDKEVVEIVVRDSNETDGIGSLLTEENSDFIELLKENNSNVDTVSGATVTSNALINAVKHAIEARQG